MRLGWPFINGVARVLAVAETKGLNNIRIHDDDARLLIRRLPAASIGRVFLLFSDPWPKRRHHKRRFVNACTLDALARILKPGGEIVSLNKWDIPIELVGPMVHHEYQESKPTYHPSDFYYG